MFFTNQYSKTHSFEWLFQFLHFLRLHQIVYQFTLVTIILFFSSQSSLFQIFSAFIMILLITPSFLLMNDILGKKDDEEAGQKRILFSDHFNKLFFLGSISLMLCILLLNNVSSFLSYVLLFISTLSYAATKYLRKMLLSYLFRYLSSIFTFSLYIFILIGYISNLFMIFMVFVSLLDLVGNIAGDIRDTGKDSLVGIKTLVTTRGKDFTLGFMFFLMFVSFFILIYSYPNALIAILLLLNVIPFLLINKLHVRFSHGIFHLSKIINYLLVALILSNVDFIIFLSLFIFNVSFWVVAYYFYLLNSVSNKQINIT